MEPIFSFKHKKIKESLITIAGNRGTPLTLKLMLIQTYCFLMFQQDFLEVRMMPEPLKILHYSMKLRRETYGQTQLPNQSWPCFIRR